MANGLTQLKGTFKLAPAGSALVNYSSVVSRAGITVQRNTYTLPAVLSTAEETEAAGTIKRMLNLTFRSTTVAASLWGVLMDIIDNDDALADWSLQQNDTATSADNPIYTGTAMLPQLDGMPDVGALRQQSITLPITVWNTPTIV